MVQYSSMRFWPDKGVCDRTIDRLLALRAGLAKDVTASSKTTSFHLATWNIRDFGGHKLNPCPRSDEALVYIAEIVSAFDLVAIQEVNDDLAAFDKLIRLMGSHWDYMVTDTSGNQERLAFVFDKRKISFRHIAGEIVLPEVKGKPVAQFNRTPYLVSFQAGWFKFNLCTVHIYYGSATATAKRIAEIDAIAQFFAKRQKQTGETYILLGDFNILNPDDATMKPLLGGGFEIPAELRNPTALASVNYYDQIALKPAKRQVEIVKAGVFDWQNYVFRAPDDYETYKPLITGKNDLATYKKWRTWQISDHKPLWAEIRMDFTDDYLKSLKSDATPLADFKPK
jgi:Endonuclease/Exonuclease/phosphatase family.